MTTIVKADGTKETFDADKLRTSLKRAGAHKEAIAKIIAEVTSSLEDGMTTQEIYRTAFSLLKEHERGVAPRYSMRRALLSMGPTGFPFEDFVAEIFRARGYTTKTGTIVEGACATHEVDLLATKDNECIVGEVKFHNNLGIKTDLKVALYVHARFIDIIDRRKERREICEVSNGLLITNTKFTKNSMKYGSCSGFDMVGWNYPDEGNLQDLIEEAKVHPVTCLTGLSNAQKGELLKKRIVLCRQLTYEVDTLKSIGLSSSKIDNILAESASLCGPSTTG